MSRFIHCDDYLAQGDKNIYEIHNLKVCIGCEEKYIKIHSADDYCRECLVEQRKKLRLQEQEKAQKVVASMTRSIRVVFGLLFIYICSLTLLHFTFGKIPSVFFWMMIVVPMLGTTVWVVLNGLKIREFIAIQDADIEMKVFSIFPYSETELKDQAKKTR